MTALRRYAVRAALAVLTCLSLAAPASAERLALVIGMGAYESPHLPALPNPLNDAEDMGAVLSGLGFEVTPVANVGARELVAALRAFRTEVDARRPEIAAVFFAGHAIQSGGRSYLFPVDAAPETVQDLGRDAVTVREILGYLRGTEGLRLVILDACRDNGMVAHLAEQDGEAARSASLDRGLGRFPERFQEADALIAYATAAGKTAADGRGRNSPYTAALKAVLPTPGVEIDQVFRLVRDQVLAATNRGQAPDHVAQRGGRNYFLAAAAPEPEPEPEPGRETGPSPAERLAYRTAVAAAEAQGSAAPLRAFLERFPESGFAAEVAAAAELLEGRAVAPGASPEPEGFWARLTALPQGAALKECDVCPEMVAIPGGTFTMGEGEGAIENVTIQPFAMGVYEVTFEEWDACAADGFCRAVPTGGAGDYYGTDRGWGRGRRPVMEVSLSDIVGEARDDMPGFLAWLNSRPGVAGAGDSGPYRLPTEAEWEYAARAGTTTRWSFGDDARALSDHAWYSANSDGRTQPVGGKAPNGFGLYDMHGNVWEWVQDCWNVSLDASLRNGSARLSGECSDSVLRGGSWGSGSGWVRSAYRLMITRDLRGNFYIGFRVSRTAGD